MEGDFFQTLRKIQKEERNKGTLSRVGNDFYKKTYDYIKQLERSVGNNPFANEQHLLLKNSQRIATDICEIRENKITEVAVRNIQRSFYLFNKEKPQFDLVDTTPLNLTSEEETLYFSIMDSLKNHRSNISLDKFAEENPSNAPIVDFEDENYHNEITNDVDESFEPKSNKTIVDLDLSNENNDSNSPIDSSSSISNETSSNTDFSKNQTKYTSQNTQNDPVLDKLDQIQNAKIITDEKFEPIEKQIENSKETTSKEPSKDKIKSSKDKSKSSIDTFKDKISQSNMVDNSDSDSSSEVNLTNIYVDDDEQFVDLDKLNNNYEEYYFNQLKREEDIFNQLDSNLRKSKPKKSNNKPQNISNSKTISSQDSSSLTSQGSSSSGSKDSSLGYQGSSSLGSEDSSNSDSSLNLENKREDVDKSTIMICEDINSFVCIDEKIYGPFSKQDVVILPEINANILIDNNKAKLINL